MAVYLRVLLAASIVLSEMVERHGEKLCVIIDGIDSFVSRRLFQVDFNQNDQGKEEYSRQVDAALSLVYNIPIKSGTSRAVGGVSWRGCSLFPSMTVPTI